MRTTFRYIAQLMNPFSLTLFRHSPGALTVVSVKILPEDTANATNLNITQKESARGLQ